MSPLERDIIDLYQRLDAEIRRVAPVCRACGECCDFPNQGHVLYATTAEVELAAAHAPRPDAWPDQARCPSLVEGKCTNRRHRPIGCRVYFCDPAFGPTSHQLYAGCHDRLKAILARHAQPYRYAPFLERLAELWA